MFYSNKPSPNSWDYAFEAENGIKQSATGEMKLVGEEEVVVMRGSYEYIGADGLTYVVDWEADENGFRAAAPHLPKGPSTYYVITFKGEGEGLPEVELARLKSISFKSNLENSSAF